MKIINKVNMFGVVTSFLLGTALHAVEPPKNIISMEKAQTTALKKYPGTVKSSELEKEEGKWVYSFDILGSDKNINEVWVDAKSGKIVKHKIESAGEEATEKEEQSRE